MNSPGFTLIMPWMVVKDEGVPDFKVPPLLLSNPFEFIFCFFISSLLFFSNFSAAKSKLPNR